MRWQRKRQTNASKWYEFHRQSNTERTSLQYTHCDLKLFQFDDVATESLWTTPTTVKRVFTIFFFYKVFPTLRFFQWKLVQLLTGMWQAISFLHNIHSCGWEVYGTNMKISLKHWFVNKVKCCCHTVISNRSRWKWLFDYYSNCERGDNVCFWFQLNV